MGKARAKPMPKPASTEMRLEPMSLNSTPRLIITGICFRVSTTLGKLRDVAGMMERMYHSTMAIRKEITSQIWGGTLLWFRLRRSLSILLIQVLLFC